MARYTDYTLRWSQRAAISIDDAGGTPGAADARLTIPPTLEEFWDATTGIQAGGADIRVTAADGVTLMTYKLSTFTYATRTCVIDIQNGSGAGSAGQSILWLYWGNATATTAVSVFVTGATPHTGYILTSALAPDLRQKWAVESYDTAKPSQRFQKTPNAQRVVAVDYRSILAQRRFPFAGGTEDEEPATVTYAVYSGALATQSAMVDATATRIDNRYVYVLVKAGSDATDYYLSIVIVTTSPTGPARTLEHRAVVQVSDLIP